MNLSLVKAAVLQQIRARPVLAGAVGLVVLLLLILVVFATRRKPPEATAYEVKRGDFLISIVEGGTLEAVNEVIVRNEVEGMARIIFIVKEGTYVKKGDLLVELDSSGAEDQVNQQQINFEKAQFAQIQAEQQLEIQKSIVDSEVKAAALKLEFAEKTLEKYLKGEMLQQLRNAEIEITNTLENLKIAEDRLTWSEKLYEQGFETKSNLDKDRLSASQTGLRLEQAQLALKLLQEFDHPKRKREYEAAVDEARENLERTKLQGERRLAQFEADVLTQKNTLELSRRKLERDREQLVACKIYAPQDGLVAYPSGDRWSNESMIEEGANVRNRQTLIKLPDTSRMKLLVRIHESLINQVSIGLPAFVVLDSMPDRRFAGRVNRVAPLPDSSSRYGNPNLKVYSTEVLVTDPLPDVKPGVSARAEIIITNLTGVLTLPIQAVTTLGGKPVVYLADTTPAKSVPVEVGLYNQRFIEIVSGLAEGDRVLLAPPFDTQSKDLSGGVLAKGEKPPESAPTNGIPPMPAPPPNGGPGSEPRAPVAEGARPGGEERGAGPPGERGTRGPRFNREEMLKRFDKDGNGELSDAERAAMMTELGATFGGRRGEGGPRGGGEGARPGEGKSGPGAAAPGEPRAPRDGFPPGRGRTNGPPVIP